MTSRAAPSASTPLRCFDLLGMQLAEVDSSQLLDFVFDQLDTGSGGWIVTANLDFLRRYHLDPEMRALYDDADIRVADGMPLVWAARLQGDRCPERVAGSSLIWMLADRAARESRSLFLLGGEGHSAELAADRLRERHPELRIAGCANPWISNPPTEAELDEIDRSIATAQPDLLLVGFGSPKQEHVIRHLRSKHPAIWMMGVGISFSFVAGHVRRAPVFLQRTGLEWVHRLAQEPRRLGRRYLLENLPFSLVLFGHALRRRRRR